MLCPSCTTSLKNITRRDVLMEFCSQCKGVWLTHDAIEKLCNRVHALEQAWNNEHRQYSPQPHYYADDDHYYLQYPDPRRLVTHHPWSEVFEDLD